MSYNTLHIFGYGECQLITDTENKKVPTYDCASAQTVVDMVYALKPVGNTASADYHAINIFNDLFADYQSLDGSFRVEYAELDATLINQLVLEIENA